MKSAYPDLTVLKIGEPFFQSLSAFASDPRRRADAPVITYSALSSSNRLHWVQMPSKQRSIPAEIAVPCRTPMAQVPTCQAISQIFKDRYSNPSIRTDIANSWAQAGGAPARRCTSYSSDAASALALMKSSSSCLTSPALVRYARR